MGVPNSWSDRDEGALNGMSLRGSMADSESDCEGIDMRRRVKGLAFSSVLLLLSVLLPVARGDQRWTHGPPRGVRPVSPSRSITVLATGGTITGRVMDSKGSPISGIGMLATIDDKNYVFPDGDTDANGQYFFRNLAAGQYFVNAFDFSLNQYVDTWYPDVWDTDFHRGLALATAVAVSDGATATADFRLPLGARILLSLKDPAGAPIVVPKAGASNGCWGDMFVDFNGKKIRINGACVGGRDYGNGTYEPYVAPVGRTYYLEGWPIGSDYLPVYYNQKPTLETATPILLSGPGPLPLTITMGATGHSISGKFSFATPQDAINNASIYVYAPDRTSLRSLAAAADQTFRIPGLADGDYVVEISVRATKGGVRTTYRKFFANAALFDGATRIRVQGSDVGSINVVMDTPADAASLVTNTKQISLVAPAGASSDPTPLAIWTDSGTVTWTAAGTSAWLRVTPATGSVTANQGATLLNVSADASSLAAGTYQDTLTITGSTGSALQIPVSLQVSAIGAVANKPIALSIPFIEFSGSTPQFSTQTVTVSNPGSARATWDLRSRLVESYPASGALDPGASVPVAIAVSITGVTFGSVTGQLEVRTNGRLTSVVPVSVNVAPPPAPAGRLPLDSPAGKGGLSTQAVDVQLARVVPAVASNLGGSSGSIWSSDVFLASLPSKLLTNNASFTLTPFGSQNGSGSVNIRGVVRAPMLTLASPVSTMFRQPSGYGALEIRPESGAVATWTRVWTAGRDGKGTYGQEIPAYDSASVLIQGDVGILPVLLGGEAFRSNLQLTEVRGAAITVRLNVRDASGKETGARDVTLAPYEQRTLQGFLPAALTVAYAEVRVTGGGAVGALASLIDNSTNDPTTILMTKRPSRTSTGKLIVPGIIRGDGAAETVWRSDVWIVNSGDVPLTFVPVLYSSGASPKTASAFTIAPHAQATLRDPLQSLFGMQSGAGALLLDVKSGDPSAVRMTSRAFTVDSAGGTLGQDVQPARDTDEVKNGDPGLALFGVARNRSFRTNLQIQETSGSPVTVEISATGTAANSINIPLTSPRTNVPLPAFGFLQFADILGQLAFTDEVTNPRITVKVISGSGSVIAYASMIDSTTGDATTVPSFRLQQ